MRRTDAKGCFLARLAVVRGAAGASVEQRAGGASATAPTWPRNANASNVTPAHALLLERLHRPPRTAALSSHQNTMQSPPVSHRARAIALL
eukprot:scaffold19457_cov140-Isochrysis_galbana.AAC.5